MHARSFAWTIHLAEITLRPMGEAKKKKHRDCPAKGGIITPEDCGRGRNSAIACPVDCPHNPFALANYREQFMPLESKLIDQISRKLMTAISPSQLRELADVMKAGDEFTNHALQVWYLIGEGRLAQWKADGFTRGWKNDELVMLGYFETLRPALIEVREVIDRLTCTAVDLLRPEMPPFTVIDSGVATVACRYDVILGWLYDLPAGQRFSGGAILLPGIDGQDPRAVFRELLDHLGAPADDPDRWLMEHMPLLSDAFAAITVARREKQLRTSDLRRFTIHHPLDGKNQVDALVATLEGHPRIFLEEPDERQPRLAGALLKEGADRDRDEEAGINGQIRVFADRLEVIAFSESNANAARAFVASLGFALGPGETTEGDLSAAVEPRPFDQDLVPASFLETVAPIDFSAAVRLKDAVPVTGIGVFLREFPDAPLPLLGGKTPREAAADPVLRPALVLVMKEHVRSFDKQRRTRGEDVDLNPLLKDLGLDELILPPPPLGFVEEEEYEEEIPLDPPPLQSLLEGEELETRLDRVISDEALWNRLDIRLADVLDAFNDLSEKLNPNELEALQSTVLSALGALHPDQPPGYEPIPERMLARYESWMRSGDDQESIGDYLDRIFAESRQPQLCEAAADLLIFLEKESGKKLRPKKLDALFTAIAAAVWEAAHWPPILK